MNTLDSCSFFPRTLIDLYTVGRFINRNPGEAPKVELIISLVTRGAYATLKEFRARELAARSGYSSTLIELIYHASYIPSFPPHLESPFK